MLTIFCKHGISYNMSAFPFYSYFGITWWCDFHGNNVANGASVGDEKRSTKTRNGSEDKNK